MMKNRIDKLVFLMNLIAVPAWLVITLLLIPYGTDHSVMHEQFSTALFFTGITCIPAFTAFCLFNRKRGRINLAAQILNYALAIFYGFSFFALLRADNADVVISLITFAIVIPALINIVVLKKLRNTSMFKS